MGKARVNSHLGGGLYDVVYWRDVERARKRLEEIEQRQRQIKIDRYGPGGSVDKKNDASYALSVAQQNLLVAIDAWANCAKVKCESESSLKAEVVRLTKVKGQKNADFAGYAALDAALQGEEMALLKEIGNLQSTATDNEYESMQVFAVDYPHEDQGPIPAGTVVGTTESYGAKGSERGQADVELPHPHINILPSWNDEANYDESRDHQQRPFGAMTTSEALMNMMQFLYVANKNPSYCVGTLQSKDDQTNTGTVTISGVTPAGREPEGFEYQTLSSVPIVYQECHAKVFKPGDKVVVKFGAENFGNPTVIGFAENPKECKMLTLTYTSDPGGTIVGVTPQEVVKGTDGTEIAVVTTGTTGFLSWSDGSPQGVIRIDTNVQASITANAILSDTGVQWPDTYEMQLHRDIYSPYAGDNWSGSFWGGDGSFYNGSQTHIVQASCDPYSGGAVSMNLQNVRWIIQGGIYWINVMGPPDYPYTEDWAQKPNFYSPPGLGSIASAFSSGAGAMTCDGWDIGTFPNYGVMSHTWGAVTHGTTDCTAPYPYQRQWWDGDVFYAGGLSYQDFFAHIGRSMPATIRLRHYPTGQECLYFIDWSTQTPNSNGCTWQYRRYQT